MRTEISRGPRPKRGGLAASAHLTLATPRWGDSVTVPMLQMQKRRLRAVRSLAIRSVRGRGGPRKSDPTLVRIASPSSIHSLIHSSTQHTCAKRFLPPRDSGDTGTFTACFKFLPVEHALNPAQTCDTLAFPVTLVPTSVVARTHHRNSNGTADGRDA